MHTSTAYKQKTTVGASRPFFLDSGNRGEFASVMEFAGACFTLSSSHPKFSAIAGESELNESTVANALDESIPVLTKLADQIDNDHEVFFQWNVKATGRSQVILEEIDRNWKLLERMERGILDGESA